MPVENLTLNAVVGFGGSVCNGLLFHPNGTHIIYPLGSTIVVKDLRSNSQSFLQGHSNKITCIALSHDSTRLASGQMTHMGCKADAIIWDLSAAIRNQSDPGADRSGELLHRLKLHLVKVQDLAFSNDDTYLASLGGQDDNSLVIWRVADGEPVCGNPAGPDCATCVRWFNGRNDRLVMGGNYMLRVWKLDFSNRKMTPADTKFGQLKRVIKSLSVSENDQSVFCGTKTGDLVEVAIDCDFVAKFPRFSRISKDRFGKGIMCTTLLTDGSGNMTGVIVGAGDGTVAVLNSRLQTARSATLAGAVTSVSFNRSQSHFYAGTDASNTYYVRSDDLSFELRGTCHAERINDVVFPKDCSDIFLTCSLNDIRVWNARTRQELLRIQVPNLECNCVGITPNGGTILSGWTDGRVRAFFPETGRLKFVITDAHSESVTALAATHEEDERGLWRIVSGGKDGRVRVWKVSSNRQLMEASTKEHRGPVNAIRIVKDNTQAVSASADGSCIIWDLTRFVRITAMFASTVFRSALYHPDESQIVTCGSDRKITYWDAYDGSAIRIIDGSGEAELCAVDIDAEGGLLTSGGGDRLVKVWHYDDGRTCFRGAGHSDTINCVKISPDSRTIVSVGSEGAIFLWTMPTRAQAEGTADN